MVKTESNSCAIVSFSNAFSNVDGYVRSRPNVGELNT